MSLGAGAAGAVGFVGVGGCMTYGAAASSDSELRFGQESLLCDNGWCGAFGSAVGLT